ncbi:M20 family metallo-hydrolase [Sutcliffiella cohnii]
MINSKRLEDRITKLATIGKVGETGVSRLAHSIEDKIAMDLVASWMAEAGMKTEIDCYGNVIGVYEGTSPSLPRLVLGSHIDSQPRGGRFDGTIGVIGAIEVVQVLNDSNLTFERSIEVVAFSDEEGARFNKGLFGVRGLTGNLTVEDLLRKDSEGISRKQALENIGITTNEAFPVRYSNDNVFAFLEMHIEQGPLLESKELPVGIVQGISGPLWLTVEFKGHSGHAGSVPMNLRKDALVGAARVIYLFDELLKQDQTIPTVGTVGYIENFPNSRNSISDRVTFTVDLRDILPERRTLFEQKLYEIIAETVEEYQLDYSISVDTNSEPKYCADWIKDILKDELQQMGQVPYELMSGPFHDALMMAEISPFGMIFVRCKDGLSHHPNEYASIDDITTGTNLLYKTVLRIL